jgi:RND family efflux transporter MFP subunit
MKRFILPIIGILAATWAAYSITRTQPHRDTTNPPSPPPVSEFQNTVAAVGLVEASTENISIGTPLSGVVAKIFVTAGQSVKKGDPLFELDLRNLRAELQVKEQALVISRTQLGVAQARLEDMKQQFNFFEKLEDKRVISEEEFSQRRNAVEVALAEVKQATAQIGAAESQLHATQTEIERSTIRSPLNAEVLQVKVRPGEFATAAITTTPLVLLGRSKPLHVRVDVDEHEAWRVHPDAKATGHIRGNPDLKSELQFVRFEPFVVPKKSLTGDSTERVDTRVLQIIYKVERDDFPIFVGQQMDVFIDRKEDAGTK